MKKACAALLVAGMFAAFSCAPHAAPPRYAHLVVVVEENHSASQVMGSPYLSDLAARGAYLSHCYGITHPSQPNYLALFSGSTQGVAANSMIDLTAPNLATALVAAGLTFTGFSEGLPAVGFRGEASGRYVRRHNPWASFLNVANESNRPFSDFPTDYRLLPTVSFVVPNLDNDMHDGTVAAGDAWLQANIDGYARWAVDNNSLLVVTFDECDPADPVATAPIATIIVGAGVKVGTFDARVDLYSILLMIESICGLPLLDQEAYANRIAGIWG
jgi:hypothetical protein